MIEWYSNSEAGIFFDDIPHLGIRYYIPSMSLDEKKSIEKYPFINKKALKVRLADYSKDKTYNFEIPKGYCYDGATIPKIFWRVIGANTDNRFLVPALIHDVLCENHAYVDNDSYVVIRNTTAAGSSEDDKYEYYVQMVDEQGNGFGLMREADIERDNVILRDVTTDDKDIPAGSYQTLPTTVSESSPGTLSLFADGVPGTSSGTCNLIEIIE